MNAENGLIHLESKHSVDETLQRLRLLLEEKKIMIFTLIDHSGEAAKAGLAMRPTKLLIFGNPKGGTPLMQAAPTVAIDLPLKALVWQDVGGNTWVSYNDPAWLAQRHGLDPGDNATTAAMSVMLDAITRAAAASA